VNTLTSNRAKENSVSKLTPPLLPM